MKATSNSWDIFCAVVDNFGDIGVCWRLARQLALEQGASVRLWVDDLASFQVLCPELDNGLARQVLRGVEIRQWSTPFPPVAPADVVVEGFGCRLPDSFVLAMQARAPQPVWLNLEYLSAEDWVESHHGLASPHPKLSLVKYFFFPGFTHRTGGLALEHGLAKRRDAFQHDAAAVDAFRASIGAAPAAPTTLVTSLFCYADSALPDLIDAWTGSGASIECLVPIGPATQAIAAHTGTSLQAGESWQRGRLRVQAVPFLDQDGYDRLLWASDLNFVRGEDSFVRAQAAGRPMVWQIYPQKEGAHLVKLDAFLERYLARMPRAIVPPVRDFWHAWNRPGQANADWPGLWRGLAGAMPEWRTVAHSWSASLMASPTLADNLAFFSQTKLK